VNLADLRNYVRTQTQTTTGELPDTTIDPYLREGFNRTVAYENQWPWFEKTWVLAQPANTGTIPLPGDVNTSAVVGLLDANGWRINFRSQSTAEESWAGAPGAHGGRYVEASIWAREINLWPAGPASEELTYQLTGFRLPIDWMLGGPASEPDIDPRLHAPLAHYAIALAYAQQEDDTLEQQYMQRWQKDVEQVRSAIMEPSQDRPLIMGPQWVSPIGHGGSHWPYSIVINTPS